MKLPIIKNKLFDIFSTASIYKYKPFLEKRNKHDLHGSLSKFNADISRPNVCI